ncbi:MAG: hypothetical protein R3F30_12795 [Planctomycetota bacterium]
MKTIAATSLLPILLLIPLPAQDGAAPTDRPAAASEEGGTTIRLRSGRFLVAQVLEVDEEKLLVRRIDNGGQLELRWSDLLVEEERRLKAQNNLVNEIDESEVRVRGIRVKYRDKTGATQEVEGELVTRDTERIVLRRKGNQVEILVKDLRGTPQEVDLPIGDILTRDEIYQRKLEEIAPGEDADKHVLLATWLIRVDLLDKAKVHLDKAQELGGGIQPTRTAGLLKRVDSLINNKEQADLLGQITIAKNRKQFTKALQLCDQFEKDFPASPLKEEYDTRKQGVLDARETYFVRRVTQDWYDVVYDEAARIAGDKKLEMDEAMNLAENELGKRIREKIAKRHSLEVQEVEGFFKDRIERKVFKPKRVGYGLGTWILGKADILKGTKQGESEEAGKKEQDPAGDAVNREFQKRLQEFLRRQRNQQKGPAQEQTLETPAQWWRNSNTQQRKQWLVAYYAERGGDFDVYYAGLEACTTCSGAGFLEIQDSTTGNVIKQTCPTCHGERFQRFIRFR